MAILPGNLADATVAGERVRVAFQAAAGTVADCRLDGTVSIGAAGGGIDVAALIAAADAALYRAKAGGPQPRRRHGAGVAGDRCGARWVPQNAAAGGMVWHVNAKDRPPDPY